MVNKTRAFFVTREMAQAVLDACPDLDWRLIFALARFGGLRCPSEVLSLLLEDIDWANGEIRVRSSKLESNEDGGERLIPIFPELRTLLLEACERAAVGQRHVVVRYRDVGANLGTHMRRIIRRAGLKVWPRTFQNCRASCETELARDHPLHVVCEWIGNSAKVATSHYMQVLDQDFKKAAAGGAISGAVVVQNAVQHDTVSGRMDSQEKRKSPENPGSIRDDAASCEATQYQLEAPPGFEHGPGNIENSTVSKERDAQDDARQEPDRKVDPNSPQTQVAEPVNTSEPGFHRASTPLPPELEKLVSVWADLPDAIKNAIGALASMSNGKEARDA